MSWSGTLATLVCLSNCSRANGLQTVNKCTYALAWPFAGCIWNSLEKEHAEDMGLLSGGDAVGVTWFVRWWHVARMIRLGCASYCDQFSISAVRQTSRLT